jgi:hypothetical protein
MPKRQALYRTAPIVLILRWRIIFSWYAACGTTCGKLECPEIRPAETPDFRYQPVGLFVFDYVNGSGMTQTRSTAVYEYVNVPNVGAFRFLSPTL